MTLWCLFQNNTVNLDLSAKILIGDPNVDKTESAKFKSKLFFSGLAAAGSVLYYICVVYWHTDAILFLTVKVSKKWYCSRK